MAAKTKDRFGLITKLISTPETIEGAVRDFVALEDMVRKDFLRLTGDFCFPGESRLYNELLLLLNDLRDLVEFPHLANKNVVAIGGGFSSGKSKFINALLGGERLLPTGINPTTAIPTFLTHAKEETIRALNTFNRTELLSREDFRAISHAFNEDAEDEDADGTAQSSISFYHILKLVQIGAPSFRWRNIAFLDTPGYSKPHASEDDAPLGTDAGNTDEEKAREHLSEADFLIWAVPAVSGTVRQDDIDFLRDKVKWNRPIYLLITKCDQSTDDDLAAQVDEIRSTFAAHFTLAGWCAHSAKRKAVLMGDDPSAWLDAIDKKQKFTRWRGRFKDAIDQVIAYNAREETNYASDLEKGFRTLYTNADGILSEEDETKVKNLVDKLSRERKSFAAAKKQFVFFEERLERKLDAILKSLGVAEETAAAVGLRATCRIDESLLGLRRSATFEGTVTTYSKFNGCYITSSALSSEVHIRKDDLFARYTNPEKVLAKGRKVVLELYEIKSRERTAVFTVKPGEMGGKG